MDFQIFLGLVRIPFEQQHALTFSSQL